MPCASSILVAPSSVLAPSKVLPLDSGVLVLSIKLNFVVLLMVNVVGKTLSPDSVVEVVTSGLVPAVVLISVVGLVPPDGRMVVLPWLFGGKQVILIGCGPVKTKKKSLDIRIVLF